VTSAVRNREESMRLNRFLAEAGVAARRKADEMITAGQVQVNGRKVTQLGTMVDPVRDEVKVNGAPVYIDHQLVYIVLNKPKDCITTTEDEKGRTTVLDLVPHHHRLYPVGRLDRNTTGVLLMTNDGDLAFRLTHPKFHAPKLYQVELRNAIKPQDVEKLRRGVRLDDGVTAPCEVEVLDPPRNQVVGIVLHEGRNRQVRRMIEAVGHDVRKLERIEFAGLTTAGLKRGAWRYLDEHEIGRLRKLASSAPAK
jgi:23S rRNA pseudouridine2605 synthase